jgi:hypothetical protein
MSYVFWILEFFIAYDQGGVLLNALLPLSFLLECFLLFVLDHQILPLVHCTVVFARLVTIQDFTILIVE